MYIRNVRETRHFEAKGTCCTAGWLRTHSNVYGVRDWLRVQAGALPGSQGLTYSSRLTSNSLCSSG